MEEIINKCLAARNNKLSLLAVAFIEEIGFKPSECELVEQMKGTEVIYFFRKKSTTTEN